jgi:hypothetical protein
LVPGAWRSTSLFKLAKFGAIVGNDLECDQITRSQPLLDDIEDAAGID